MTQLSICHSLIRCLIRSICSVSDVIEANPLSLIHNPSVHLLSHEFTDLFGFFILHHIHSNEDLGSVDLLMLQPCRWQEAEQSRDLV